MSTTTDSFNTSGSELMGFQCSSCLVNFWDDVNYKLHYRSEFHKYNVLRKMVGLPVVTQDNFQKHLAESKRLADSKELPKTESQFCQTCNKKFGSRATMKQHLATKRHLNAERELANNIELGNLGLDTACFKKEEFPRSNPIEDNKSCLFCNLASDNFKSNLAHMEKKHGFFIIDKKFCIDLEGLYDHIAKKIFVKKLCVFCDNHKCGNFKSGMAVQNHMVDRGHCFMNGDFFEEFDDFYDFEEEEERLAKVAEEKYKDAKFGDEVDYEVKKKEKKEKEEDEDEDWEDVGSDVEEMMEEKEMKGEKNEGERKKKTRRVFKLRRARLLDTGELLLPSGKIVGHKDYKQYYKQRPRIREETQMRQLGDGRSVYTGRRTYAEAVMLREAIRGGNGGALMLANYNRFLMKERMKADKVNKVGYHRQAHNWMRLGITGNKTLTKHFRLQYRQ